MDILNQSKTTSQGFPLTWMLQWSVRKASAKWTLCCSLRVCLPTLNDNYANLDESWLFCPAGPDVHVYDIPTRTVKTKTWSNLPACTSALRWLEHYYCFHGHNFTRFHPVTGEVSGMYPKDARNYFMKCDNFGKTGDIKHTGTYMQVHFFSFLLYTMFVFRAWPWLQGS